MKKLLYFILFLAILAILGFTFYLYPRLPILNGYSAKMACSCIFVSGRSLESVKNQELETLPFKSNTTVNQLNKSVTSDFLGFHKQTAIYKENLGCMVLQGEDDYKIGFVNPPKVKTVPLKDAIQKNKKLEEALDFSFDKPGEDKKQTRTVAVLHKGELIAERYITGFSKETPILGWSMCKSICNALVGIRIKQSNTSLEDYTRLPAWEKDERKNITINNLLQMQSGLDWQEVYSSLTDPTRMFYTEESTAHLAFSKKASHPAGSHWIYSSGTTNILSYWLRRQFEEYQEYLAFPYKELFEPLGIASATLELDEAGTYVLSSYGHMTTRDWAKLGQLYLNDGIWNGDRILPEGWVKYSTTPNAHSEQGVYGAHIWLNSEQARFPDAPKEWL